MFVCMPSRFIMLKCLISSAWLEISQPCVCALLCVKVVVEHQNRSQSPVSAPSPGQRSVV